MCQYNQRTAGTVGVQIIIESMALSSTCPNGCNYWLLGKPKKRNFVGYGFTACVPGQNLTSIGLGSNQIPHGFCLPGK